MKLSVYGRRSPPAIASDLAPQLTDELGSSPTDWAHVPAHIRALLDKALGPEGYYAVITTNMHTDYATHDGANTIVMEAVQRGVPVVSAQQMLDELLNLRR